MSARTLRRIVLLGLLAFLSNVTAQAATRAVLEARAVVTMASLPQKSAPERWKGERKGAEPPPDWFCSPAKRPESHHCECRPTSHPTADDPFCEEQPRMEDNGKCLVACRPNQCRCPADCKDPAHHHEAAK